VSGPTDGAGGRIDEPGDGDGVKVMSMPYEAILYVVGETIVCGVVLTVVRIQSAHLRLAYHGVASDGFLALRGIWKGVAAHRTSLGLVTS